MSKFTYRGPRFSSKTAMILTCMGMAVGTGNIWRFPREVAKNGGGSFLIPWIIFLVLWSIPLLMVELSAGQHTRKGPFGAFAKLLGEKFAWMGGFICICAMMIMCYYAVVTGWCLRYLGYALQGQLSGLSNEQAISLFDGFRNTPASLVFHFLAVGLAAFFVYRGAKGIEWLNKILIPALILILALGAVKALMMVGSSGGLGYLFSVEVSRLGDASHWIAGLTQSAWSTGAGWGLMMAYAVYARDNEDPVTTPMATGVGNNSIEVIVALMIFPAMFAIMGLGAVDYLSGTSWKGGIAFQTAPLIFDQMTGGAVINALFFFGLSSAALTSLVALVELGARFFTDLGFERKTGLAIVIGMCVVLGTPSALSDTVFDNQDYVWGVGLIVAGLFQAFLVLRFGAVKYAAILNRNASFLKAGRWFPGLIVFVMIEGLALLAWWLADDLEMALWCFGQWAVVIALLLVFRKRLTSRLLSRENE